MKLNKLVTAEGGIRPYELENNSLFPKINLMHSFLLPFVCKPASNDFEHNYAKMKKKTTLTSEAKGLT